jgi:hypothetical protein
MFQYAFGLAAARLLGTDFHMDETLLRGTFALASRGGPREAELRRAAAEAAAFPPRELDNDVFFSLAPRELLGDLTDRTHYVGFFQSEEFLDGVAADVRADFQLRSELREEFERRYASLLGTPYVCCHVRRTDYLLWGTGPEAERPGIALPASYYERCLELLGPAPGVPIVFVGDDLSVVREHFRSRPGCRFEHNREGVDLALLMNAQTVVASNSTFAWWGAWLNPGRPVVAPRYWMGFREEREYPPRVIPADWTQLEVPA